MLDIIFISYDEPNADKNYAALKARFPHARRVHGVKGIANAHIAASKKALTSFFYVVDADAVINTFDFTFKPEPGEEDFVHLWYAWNPALGEAYGYGGVKLFSKKMFKNVKTQLDFTTTLTKDIKIHKQVACRTEFNSDPTRAFRGAFREAAKLQRIVSTHPDEKIRKEAWKRLYGWQHPAPCNYREYVEAGANAGSKAALEHEDLLFINDHDYMNSLMQVDAPERDFNTQPNISSEMKNEFFFTTRLAAALYDPFVLNSLPITELRDAISDGQIYSKIWLIEELKAMLNSGIIKPNSKVVVLGGWIGTLSLMMHAYELPLKVTSVDLDERANKVANSLNYDFDGFSTLKADMYELDYECFDVIINTSSEHIPNISAWRREIPAEKIVVVQNNNYLKGDGHISCVGSDEELRNQLSLRHVDYQGTKKLPIYDRYMVIGRT